MTDFIRGDPSASLGRTKGRLLNTIIEEEGGEDQTPRHAAQLQRRKHGGVSEVKIEQWLSPMSDHFPTPRGFHFLAAPILPESPSTASVEESISPASSSPNASSPWNSTSAMTDATDFDDIYNVSENEEERRKESKRPFGSRQRQDCDSESSSPGGSRGSLSSLPQLVIPTGRDTSSKVWSGRPDLRNKIISPVAPTPTSGVPMSPAMVQFMNVQQSLEVPTISAPPSLDGSLNSDQMAQMSAPPTPVIGTEDDGDEDWSGVRLQPGALATLQSLSTLSTPTSDVDFAEQVIELPMRDEEPPREEMAERRRSPSLLFANFQSGSTNRVAGDVIPDELTAREVSELPGQPLRLATNVLRAFVILTPIRERSLAGLTRLEIPSPGGFFSGLSPRTRHTWHMPGKEMADEAEPPTSGTAERFYTMPWNMDPAPPLPCAAAAPPRPFHMSNGDFSTIPVEQIVEVKSKEEEKEDVVTARRVPHTETSSATLADSTSPVEEVTATEIVGVVDGVLARKKQEIALSHLERTELWLLAQRFYLGGLATPEEPEPQIDVVQPEPKKVEAKEVPPTPPPKDKELECTITRKKTVRFSEPAKSPNLPRSLPSKLVHQESAYYRAFTAYAVRSQSTDVFVNRLARFEAVLGQRVGLRDAHHNQLLGKYQLSVVPQSAKKRMSANVVRGDDVLTDDPAKLRMDKEADALSQMALATWHVAAWKLLNGNRLILAPVHKRLARLSRMAPSSDGVCGDRARILDLGGQATCDWAWHAALAYPNTKVYTVTTKAIRQLSNSNIRGPPNHRQVAVDRLARLPFADNQFDLIRAAELHSLLKFVGEHGEDEWESCLHECLRVLKPGGFLEFTLLDSDMVNAGKLGNAKSVEFGFALNTLGYDPAPSKLFLGRLCRAGFEATRRAWLCLPVGPRPAAMRDHQTVTRDSTGQLVPTVRLEAMIQGSTDAAAAITGLAAGWSWERWLLRTEMEKAAGELRLADIATTTSDAMREARKTLEDVPAIVEEGRACGAAWRVLRGYARKPRPGVIRTGLIDMVLDTGDVI